MGNWGKHRTKRVRVVASSLLPSSTSYSSQHPAPLINCSCRQAATELTSTSAERRGAHVGSQSQLLLSSSSPSAVHRHRRSRSEKDKRGSNLGESQQQQRAEALALSRRDARAMAAGRGFLLLLFTAAVLVGLASASPFISDSVFQGSAGSTGRSLLQAKKSCPMNFEFQNYTIITSQCKGPKFPAKECCGSFKEFACPFNTYINDESNDCASTMFSYINLYGKYPPGLFAHECREGKEGLSCDGVPQREVVASSGQRAQGSLLALITLLCGLVSLLFH